MNLCIQQNRWTKTTLIGALVACGVWALSSYHRWGFSPSLFLYVALGLDLVGLSVEDLRSRTISFRYIWIGVGLWVLYAVFLWLFEPERPEIAFYACRFVESLVFYSALLAFTLAVEKIYPAASLGGGDINLLGMLALYCGAVGSLQVLGVGCLFALGVSLIQVIVGAVTSILVASGVQPRLSLKCESATHDGTFPFAPYLVAAFWLSQMAEMPMLCIL